MAAVFEDAGLGANSAEKHTLFACQTATGRELVRRPLPTGRVRFAFSRDAKRLAIIRAGTIRIEEVQTGKARQWSTPADPTGRPVFSADGNLLALNRAAPEGEPAAVVVWDVAEGRPQLTLASGRAGFLAFSPDSRYLATAGMDALRLWELASGREVLCRPRPESYHGYHGPSFASSLAFTPDGRSVATGLLDTTVLLWGLAPDAAAAPADLRRLWQALSGEAPRAYTALWALARAPRDQVLALLRQELSPAPRPDAERVRRLLADLGSERFAVRQAATRELQAMGEAIRPALRRELEGNPPLEVRQRIAKLLDVPATLSSGKALRAVRAVEVLERLAAPEARRLLERLAGGAPAARLTREARAALARLARSPQ